MTARRQASTTSLSRYARASSPGFQNHSLDFCNAFWGMNDTGVEVLFARMRGASRTMEELRNYWKERAAIEDDYAKRMRKLSKTDLGRDEIGELRGSLKVIQEETDRQAGYHAHLAGQIRTELENTAATFHSRQIHFKKNFQAGIEKEWKAKQAQETHVNKAREKYEQDCVRINSYTAQSSLVQGKDLEKINLKLERAQATVQANERDFANFSKALAETTARWEVDWKAFCDSCQDFEEQRIEFMKDNMWAYANAVSTVCVQDDESCEKVRVSLEQMEPEKEMENFVRDYGTGNQIPDPPAFVNYNTPDAIPSHSARPTYRMAQFARSSQRELPREIPEPDNHDSPVVNTAGVGAGGSRRDSVYDPSTRSVRRQSTLPPQNQQQQPQQQQIQANGRHSVSPGPEAAMSSPNEQSIARRQSRRQSRRVPPPQDPLAEPIDPNAETFIKIGNNAYKADPTRDPQSENGFFGIGGRNGSTSPSKITNGSGAVDPLAKHMEDLKNAVAGSGSIRRASLMPQQSQQLQQLQQSQPTSPDRSIQANSRMSLKGGHVPSSSSLSLPSGSSPPPNRDYRNSAEIVVGSHPSAVPQQPSRSPSPQPPTAAFMKPRQSIDPSDSQRIQEVLQDYQQALPGERKSMTRSPSFNVANVPNARNSISPSNQRPLSIGPPGQQPPSASGHHPTQSQSSTLSRPVSQIGHAGIGAHGSRSPSPQPISRAPSPAPPPQQQQLQQQQQQALQQPQQQAGPVQRRNSFIQPPAQQVARSPSPNSVGIALGPDGRVVHDELAQRYQEQQQQQQQQMALQQQQFRPPQQQQIVQPPPQQIPQQQPPPPQQTPQPYGALVQQNNNQRRASYLAAQQQQQQAMHQPGLNYGITPPPPQGMQGMYQQPPQQQIPQSSINSRQSYLQQQQQQQQPAYGGAPSPQSQNMYNAPPPVNYAQPPPVQQAPPPVQVPPQQQQQPIQQQQQPAYQANAPALTGLQRGASLYYGNGQPQQPRLGAPQYGGGYGGYSPGRSPSPQPPPPMPQQAAQVAAPQTGQTTEDGQSILFYVKALYDYAATIEEEFDFQAGDIIAVTATPEDGWWSGELLDEDRRQKGRHIFPSNFVCLF